MSKKKISVVTATRAEYGILKPLIRRLFAEDAWQTQLLVTGTHLEKQYGSTVQEIEADSFPICRKIPIFESGDTPYAVSKMMANALRGFAEYFAQEKPDLLIVLGDRTELLAICAAALNERVPVAHLHGGELTFGAVDDSIRHAVTKMSYLHFAAAEEYRQRIIQLGEAPERVFNTGSLGVENVLCEELLDRKELAESVGFPAEGDYALVTFHPVTLEGNPGQQIEELCLAMREQKELFFLITKANADAGGTVINEYLEQEAKKCPNMKLVASLGMKRYLSAVKYAKFVLGNSSSGIIEVPSFEIPTVNIGDRQKGRIMADSIISCKPERRSIQQAMQQAMEMNCSGYKSPYGDGTTSKQIIGIIRSFLDKEHTDLKKEFYDLPSVISHRDMTM